MNDTSVRAEVPLRSDGCFEAVLPLELPLRPRGWHTLQYLVQHAGRSAAALGLVLSPPADAIRAGVVCLPVDWTWPAGGVQRMAEADRASQLSALLRRLRKEVQGRQPLYCLACAPPDPGNRHTELALAATALSWPSAHFILLPTEPAEPRALLHGIDRLRWLFIGQLELAVLNLEPAIDPLLASALAPAGERALSHRFPAEADPVSPRLEGLLLVRSRRAGAGSVPRHPVVFCHGMLAMSLIRMRMPEDPNYFSVIREFLQERGVRALFPQVTPTGGVADRARQLREQIRAWTDEPVNLIAHSMGGLDARYLISRLDMAGRVRSLTTISTPHRGTGLADWFCKRFHQGRTLLFALRALGVEVDGFRDCQVAVCRAFNAQTPDVPGVRYFSLGGAVPHSRVSSVLRRGWSILHALEGPNDGLVSVNSARWGEYLGTLAVDHFAQTPDGLFVRSDESFDALRFTCRLIEDLARRGL